MMLLLLIMNQSWEMYTGLGSNERLLIGGVARTYDDFWNYGTMDYLAKGRIRIRLLLVFKEFVVSMKNISGSIVLLCDEKSRLHCKVA